MLLLLFKYTTDSAVIVPTNVDDVVIIADVVDVSALIVSTIADSIVINAAVVDVITVFLDTAEKLLFLFLLIKLNLQLFL